MSPDERWEHVMELLISQGYVESDDVPGRNADEVLDELCSLGWLSKDGDRYVLGDVAKFHLDCRK